MTVKTGFSKDLEHCCSLFYSSKNPERNGFIVHGFTTILSRVLFYIDHNIRKMGDVTAENSAVPCHDRINYILQCNQIPIVNVTVYCSTYLICNLGQQRP